MQQVLFIELGMGADLHGQDPTKAAIRAVRDAIGRNYLPGMRALVEQDPSRMKVNVRVGVPTEPEAVDREAVRAVLPYGEVTVEVDRGGLLTPGRTADQDSILVAVVAIEVGT